MNFHYVKPYYFPDVLSPFCILSLQFHKLLAGALLTPLLSQHTKMGERTTWKAHIIFLNSPLTRRVLFSGKTCFHALLFVPKYNVHDNGESMMGGRERSNLSLSPIHPSFLLSFLLTPSKETYLQSGKWIL